MRPRVRQQLGRRRRLRLGRRVRILDVHGLDHRRERDLGLVRSTLADVLLLAATHHVNAIVLEPSREQPGKLQASLRGSGSAVHGPGEMCGNPQQPKPRACVQGFHGGSGHFLAGTLQLTPTGGSLVECGLDHQWRPLGSRGFLSLESSAVETGFGSPAAVNTEFTNKSYHTRTTPSL